MAKRTHLRPSDLHGLSRLAIDVTMGLTDLVEAVHHTHTRGAPEPVRTTGIAGVVYKSVRGVTRLVGGSIDAILGRLVPLIGERPSSPEREAVLAALNGVLGDHLVSSRNPLAIPMRLRRDGQPLELEKQALAAAIPQARGKLLVLVHGLCMSDLQWNRKGHDHGAALARDLGYTPVYLHYNSGLHISTNGHAFADLMEMLLEQWPAPLEELAIIGHSMGGLVARSAFHYASAAGHAWPRHLSKLIFLGAPHGGAPLERGGNWVDVMLGGSPYTAPFARIGKIRSAGITDLRHGILLDEDWEGRDRFEHPGIQRHPLPLPEGVKCYAIAVTTGKKSGDLKDRLLGDGIVPLDSALGRNPDPSLALPFPASRQWIGYAMSHLDLLGHADVYAQIRQWLDDRG